MSYKGTYSDIRIHFKNGGSIVVKHEVFVKVVNALNSDAMFYSIEIDSELDGLVPVGLVNLNEISHTTFFTPDNV